MNQIRPAYSNWPRYNQTLRDVIAGLTDDQLGTRPSPQRWLRRRGSPRAP